MNFCFAIVDGSWSDWSPWEECSKTCGSGKKTRTRTCRVPPGQEGGKSCLGKAVDTLVCNSEPCPGMSYEKQTAWRKIVFTDDLYSVKRNVIIIRLCSHLKELKE